MSIVVRQQKHLHPSLGLYISPNKPQSKSCTHVYGHKHQVRLISCCGSSFVGDIYLVERHGYVRLRRRTRCVANIIRETESLTCVAHLSRACVLDLVQQRTCYLSGAVIFFVCVCIVGMRWTGRSICSN